MAAHINAEYMTGPRLAAMRRLAGWSQRQLAEQCRVHIQTVKYWERDQGLIAGWACDKFKAALSAKGISSEMVAVKQAAENTVADRHASRCGARTRKGKTCQQVPVRGKKRCRFHGGLSTGPKSAEGIERIRIAQLRRWSNRATGMSCQAVQ